MKIPVICRLSRVAGLFLFVALAVVSSASAQPAWQAFPSTAAEQTGAAVMIVSEQAGDGELLARWLSARGMASFTLTSSAANPTGITNALTQLRGRATELKISP